MVRHPKVRNRNIFTTDWACSSYPAPSPMHSLCYRSFTRSLMARYGHGILLVHPCGGNDASDAAGIAVRRGGPKPGAKDPRSFEPQNRPSILIVVFPCSLRFRWSHPLCSPTLFPAGSTAGGTEGPALRHPLSSPPSLGRLVHNRWFSWGSVTSIAWVFTRVYRL